MSEVFTFNYLSHSKWPVEIRHNPRIINPTTFNCVSNCSQSTQHGMKFTKTKHPLIYSIWLQHLKLCLRLLGLGLLSFCRRSVIELGRWTRDLSEDGHNDISECVLYFGSSKYVSSNTTDAVACNVLFLSAVFSQKKNESVWSKIRRDINTICFFRFFNDGISKLCF